MERRVRKWRMEFVAVRMAWELVGMFLKEMELMSGFTWKNDMMDSKRFLLTIWGTDYIGECYKMISERFDGPYWYFQWRKKMRCDLVTRLMIILSNSVNTFIFSKFYILHRESRPMFLSSIYLLYKESALAFSYFHLLWGLTSR